MHLLSLEGKLAAAFGLVIAVATATAAALIAWLDSPWLGALAAMALLVLPALALARLLASPVAALVRALAGSVSAFRDGDFSFSIARRRNDELGELVSAHNRLGDVLRAQRQHLFQRELLLDTVVQNTPTAMVLVEPGGHVVHSNLAARRLLNAGRPFTGEAFAAIAAAAPEPLAGALAAGAEGLVSAPFEDQEETFHVSVQRFTLQGRVHRLYQVRRLTRELARQEVATWKKVIRVISHELNNSLAPIQSLSHSGRELAARGDGVRLQRVFDTIGERTRHLEGFIHGYARFAKLPDPRPEPVAWGPFIESLAMHYPFRLAGSVPDLPGWFDRAQLEQALLNLLKNAHEAGGDAAAIELAVEQRGGSVRIEVRDRGPGMGEAVLTQALLPFYSTKRSGSGLGLALVREITEAHGGRVQLANRGGGGCVVALSLPVWRG